MTNLIISALLLSQSSISVKPVRSLSDFHILALAAAPTGSKFAASLEDNNVRIMDASTGQSLRTLSGHPQPVYAIAFSRDGSLIATGDESARIFVWSVATGSKVKTFTRDHAHTRGIQSLNFSADNKTLVSCARDDSMIIWNVSTGTPTRKIEGGGCNVASGWCNPTSPAVYAATLGEGLKIYNRSSGGAVALGGHSGQGATDFATSRLANKGITGGKDSTVDVWDLSAKKLITQLKGHDDMVIHVAMSSNGRLAASSSSDRSVRIWDLANYQHVATLSDQSSVGAPLCFTGDGRYLISATANDTIQINSVSPAQGGGSTPTTSKKKRRSR